MSEIGVGVVGLGFMGRTHVRAYQDAARDGHPCRLAWAFDLDASRLSGEDVAEGNIEAGGGGRLFDPADVHTTTDLDELLADEAVHLVSVCTPTDTHAEITVRALEAGKHVLVEKPVAVTTDEVRRVADAARASGRLCMPAFCMRFWPGWEWLKARVDDREFGPVRSAAFQRLASPPSWNPTFYRDAARTGGALLDLHIHDADFVRHAFGDPREVASAGTLDHVTTLYRYDDGPAHVAAEGGWDHTPGFAFRMRYVVVFEEATADFDLGRDDPLLLCRGGEASPVELPAGAGYDGEVRHLVDLVAAGGGGELRATMDDAVAVAALLDAERASLEQGASVAVAP